jgi:hypothetical protein
LNPSNNPISFQGYVAKGWEKVQAAFEKNFAEDMEVGAGVTTYRSLTPFGRLLVRI